MTDNMNIKEQIINSLEDKLVITKVEEDFEVDTAIICEFIRSGKKGNFRFIWSKDEAGIDYVNDYDYFEDIDCIEDEIHEWVDRHFQFKFTISLKQDGKELLK